MTSLRRLFKFIAYKLLLILGVVTVLFVLKSAMPGGGMKKAHDHLEESVSKTKLSAETYLGFINELSPISYTSDSAQWEHWMPWVKISVGDGWIIGKWPYLGHSQVQKERVSAIILEGLPETLILAFAALIIAAFFGVLLGVLAGRKAGSLIDKLVLLVSSAGMAIPSFVSGIILAWLFGYLLQHITGLKVNGSLYTYNFYAGREILTLQNLWLPAIALSIRPLSVIALLMRNNMMEVMRMDYIRTARSKGLEEWKVLFKHALINALPPIITAIGAWFPALVAGSVFVEIVFGWKGLGHVLFSSINFRDFPVIIGLTAAISATFIIINSLVEWIMPWFNPRILKD